MPFNFKVYLGQGSPGELGAAPRNHETTPISRAKISYVPVSTPQSSRPTTAPRAANARPPQTAPIVANNLDVFPQRRARKSALSPDIAIGTPSGCHFPARARPC
jgi:hypothetical protein